MRGLSLPKNGLARSPRSLGYAMPAEWAPHARSWLAWPAPATRVRSGGPASVDACVMIIHLLVRHERVGLIVADAATGQTARARLEQAGVDLTQIDIVEQPTERSCLRDTAPSFLRRKDGKRAAVLWQFNAWGSGAEAVHDALLGARVAAEAGTPIWQPRRPGGGRFVLEGGALDVDGEGTLLVTEECLLGEVQARNPGVDRDAQARVLGDAVGIEQVIWLGQGLIGDATHGHVDGVARFIAPGRVVVSSETDARDANFASLADAHARLVAARDAKGRKLDVIRLPMPRPVFVGGQRLPASYTGFYVANAQVLVPTFDDPADRVALGSLRELFPEREVVGVRALELSSGVGTLRCMTQQEPT